MASLLLYQEVLEDRVGRVFQRLLRVLSEGETPTASLKAYGEWFHHLAAQGHSWLEHIQERILQADNPFSRAAQWHDQARLPDVLVAAARHDLQILGQVAACGTGELSVWVQQHSGYSRDLITWNVPISSSIALFHQFETSDDWGERLDDLVVHYGQFGVGLLAQFRAFRWREGQLQGVHYPDEIQVRDLVGYERQRERLLQNTEFLLVGYGALHVLLYGSRGSGKSSLVKGLLNHFGDRPLRLVEVTKRELGALPDIVEPLRSLPQKFIVFVDDLSFDADDDGFRALKVVLEGSITACPPNVVVYATSNRRHLVREFQGDRPSPSSGLDDIHPWDTVQEKLSFSDRFGLTLTFEPADQGTYLQIVHHLAAQSQISLNDSELEYRALQWATQQNGRSGRTARQFINFLRAEQADPSLG